MPLPTPNTGETRGQFMDRCMANPTMTGEFPDTDQRAAVCSSQWSDDKSEKAYRPAKWVTIDRQRGQFRKKYNKQMTDALDRLVKPFFDEFREGMEPEGLINMVDTIIKPDPIQEVYERMIPEIGLWFAKKEFSKAKAMAGSEIVIKSPITGLTAKQDDEEEILNDIWRTAFLKFTRDELGANIRSVTGNSKELLKKYLRQILDENPNIGTAAQTRQLQEKLKGAWKADRFWRAKRIVRTETTTASNKGNMAGIDATGKDYNKTWEAAFNNTRNDHAIAHGQTVPKGEDYMVGGTPMAHPGDPRGGASNVINCQCAQSYELVR